MRVDPFYKVRKFHPGIDFSAPVGTTVYATGNGTILLAGRENGGYGNQIVIDHGYNYQTVYAHLSRIFVVPGQKILRGQIIGYVGNTGKSTSPHLHYEVRKNGIALNPVYFFYNDLSADEFKMMLELSARPSQAMD
jgi:murein DD-endopeptidase MepM/ murein hydrolase activator NlpD